MIDFQQGPGGPGSFNTFFTYKVFLKTLFCSTLTFEARIAWHVWPARVLDDLDDGWHHRKVVRDAYENSWLAGFYSPENSKSPIKPWKPQELSLSCRNSCFVFVFENFSGHIFGALSKSSKSSQVRTLSQKIILSSESKPGNKRNHTVLKLIEMGYVSQFCHMSARWLKVIERNMFKQLSI